MIKNFISFAMCMLVCCTLFAQSLTLTFTGKSKTGQPVRLEKIVIDNLSKEWQETIVYPDTILKFSKVGIAQHGQEQPQMMLQNIPNPFDGQTEVIFQLAENDKIAMDIHDMNGKLIQSYRENLPAGTHSFRVSLNTAQTYMLSVKTKTHQASIKMVNLKSGGQNKIEYQGSSSQLSQFNFKKETENLYDLGDTMSYIGYTNIESEEMASERKNKNLTGSETISLMFQFPPVFSEVTVSDILYQYATVSGAVTASPWYNVQQKGFCFGTQENPTVSSQHIELGSGIGNMNLIIENLESNTTYYVRAYAVREDSTYYSNATSFTTLAMGAPTVTTDAVSEIDYATAVCGGEVTATGGEEVLARGICWSTTPDPTLNDAHTVDSLGLGKFVSQMKDLQGDTKYYVRAYAYNKLDTAYGNTVEFTTKDKTYATVTTADVSAISNHSAVAGGCVTFDGATSLVSCGVCFSEKENPTVTDTHVEIAGTMGNFVVSLSDLQPKTLYHVRAYVINEVGISYGEDKTFTTMEFPFATLTTAEVTDITRHTAVTGGNVLSDEGEAVVKRGVCWSNNTMPTIQDAHSEDGAGVGEFVTTLNDLIPDTIYYVRAYAENAAGVAYGQQVQFRTAKYALAEVTTLEVKVIDRFNATASARVACEEGVEVTDRGICFSENDNPTVTDSATIVLPQEAGIGEFTAPMSDLQAGHHYYVRAYAITGAGVAYGDTLSFTTLACIAPIVDNTALLKVTTKQAKIEAEIVDDGSIATSSHGFCYSTVGEPFVGDSATQVINRGGNAWGFFTHTLGNLKANTTYYVKPWAANHCTENGEVGPYTFENIVYGPMVEFTTLPVQMAQVQTNEITDITTFDAFAHGMVIDDGEGFINECGFCWSVDSNPTIDGTNCFHVFKKVTGKLSDGTFSMTITPLTPNKTYYVRAYAVNEAGIAYGDNVVITTSERAVPTVLTLPVTSISSHSATCSGQVIDDGGAAVTARGICWSTDTMPTITDKHTIDATSGTVFVNSIDSLTPETKYYIRAYATNEIGTGYGDTISLTTIEEVIEFICGKSTIKDIDGNEYYTVQIGSQCWMKENMRTRHFADGSEVTYAVGTDANKATPTCYIPFKNAPEIFGLVYNVTAYMHGADTTSKVPSGVQGICPDGWHIPSVGEFNILIEETANNYHDASCTNGDVSKALSAASDWYENPKANPCVPCRDIENNNRTGFSAYPAGILTGRALNASDYMEAYFATTNFGSSTSMKSIFIAYTSNKPTVNTTTWKNSRQSSVRCLKDN